MRSSAHSALSRALGLFVLALAILALSSTDVMPAQQKPTLGKQTGLTQATPTARNLPAIDIKVETFRKQIVPGAVLGVMADVSNKSSAPIYLREKEAQFVLPPEAARTDIGAYSWDGFFPTEWSEPEPHVICLKPNETYRIFASPNSERDEEKPEESSTLSDVWRKFRRYFQFIGFTPGEYPITVEVKYWDQRNFDGGDYHVATATKIVEFAAPQRIILLGAVLGGLIFWVLATVREEQNTANGAPPGRLNTAKASGKKIAAMVGSILMSVIITILLSRISETQFFIKVTVSDLWGAIAVGFLANYGGWALLDKMVPRGGKRGDAKNQTQTKPDSVDAQATSSSGTRSASGKVEAQTADAANSSGPRVE